VAEPTVTVFVVSAVVLIEVEDRIVSAVRAALVETDPAVREVVMVTWFAVNEPVTEPDAIDAEDATNTSFPLVPVILESVREGPLRPMSR